jgi:hypothetical protein
MAESGGVSGLLSGDAETPSEGAAPDAPTPLDPTAAALAAEAAKSDPELAQEASAYFRKQSHLIEVQTEHLHEQRAVNLSLLKLKRFDERLKLGLRVFVILVATAIGVGAVMLVRDAVSSRRVVVDLIDAPPALVAHGITGKVIASGLLDELSRLQDATRGSFGARDLTGAWTGNIKLEVPETGVSLGEISRLLKERFGHDVHIDGDLIEAPAGGLALTVRGTRVPAKTFSGSATGLEKLTLVAAEYIYSKSQPARWANYLTVNNRNEEAITFCQAAVATADRVEQPRLMNSWALALLATGGSVREALALHRAASKLQPDSWVVLGNIVNDLIALGNEEGAWRVVVQGKRVS